MRKDEAISEPFELFQNDSRYAADSAYRDNDDNLSRRSASNRSSRSCDPRVIRPSELGSAARGWPGAGTLPSIVLFVSGLSKSPQRA